MNPPSLMYHDVVAPGHEDASGFPGPAAAHYKFDGDAFERQLSALAGSGLRFPAVTTSPLTVANNCLLTFDDGGASAAHIATLLSERRMVGHFMVTTSRIGTSGFLSADSIRDLDASGHVVGSHSHTHPAEISRMPAAMLDAEWRVSVERLQQILGRPVSVASVPGGFYSRAVAQAAAAAGICFLFTSEPTVREHIVDGCLILGRYTLWRGMEPDITLALALGTGSLRQRQWLAWNLKKPVKRCARPVYHLVRRRWLGEA